MVSSVIYAFILTSKSQPDYQMPTHYLVIEFVYIIHYTCFINDKVHNLNYVFDLLFVLTRWANQQADSTDASAWEIRKS